MWPDEDFTEYQERKLEHNIQQRMLPWLIGKRAKELFNFDYCAYSMRKSKESTGRIVMYREFQIRNSFTLEATFAGTSDEYSESGIHRQFNQLDFMNIGKHTAEALWDYHLSDINIDRKAALFEDIANHLKLQIASNLPEEYKNGPKMESFIPSDKQTSPTVQRCLKILGPNLTEILETLDKGVDNGDLSTLNRKHSISDILGSQSEDQNNQDQKHTNTKPKTSKNQKSLTTQKSESEGDDSDSESEPELIISANGETKKVSKSKTKNKKKKKKNKDNSKLQNSEPQNQNQKSLKESKSNDSLDAKSPSKSQNPSPNDLAPFEDPYTKRKGNGQAFFTAERAGKKSKGFQGGKIRSLGDPINKPNDRESINRLNVSLSDGEEKYNNNPLGPMSKRIEGSGSRDSLYMLTPKAKSNQSIAFRVNSIENKMYQSSKLELEQSQVERTKLLEMQNFKFPSIDKNYKKRNFMNNGGSSNSNGWNPYNARP
jgi:hypothetical protein